jgi:hypothetical protein
MPGSPQECREHAKECLELAQSALDRAYTEKFEGISPKMDEAGDRCRTAGGTPPSVGIGSCKLGHNEPKR